MWEWSPKEEKAYRELQHILTKAPVLAYYDVSKPLVLSVDASSKGLGAAIIQQGRPVAYASRALMDCETRWAQIEKELLAIQYGCKRFHDYVAHRKVLVESDHKPLESIFKKPLYKAPMRLQRMLLALQQYEIEVTYKKWSELYIADTLSRAYLPNTCETRENVETPVEMHLIREQAPLSPEKFKQFQEETSQDEAMVEVMETTIKGWPEKKDEAARSCQEYWNIRDKLSESYSKERKS